MFEFDPIDLNDPSPYLALAYYGYLIIGSLAVIASLIALAAVKGSSLHRRAGFVFGAALLVVCLTSLDMLNDRFIAPLFMAVFTAGYATVGAWLALRKRSRAVLTAEISLSVFELAGLAIFLSIALPAVSRGVIPPIAPAVIAAIPLILIAGDINWFLRQEDRARLRIARHLSRMVWAFIVVLRAPLVELAAAGLPISQPAVVVGPIALGLIMVWYFRRKYVRKKSAG